MFGEQQDERSRESQIRSSEPQLPREPQVLDAIGLVEHDDGERLTRIAVISGRNRGVNQRNDGCRMPRVRAMGGKDKHTNAE